MDICVFRQLLKKRKCIVYYIKGPIKLKHLNSVIIYGFPSLINMSGAS